MCHHEFTEPPALLRVAEESDTIPRKECFAEQGNIQSRRSGILRCGGTKGSSSDKILLNRVEEWGADLVRPISVDQLVRCGGDQSTQLISRRLGSARFLREPEQGP